MILSGPQQQAVQRQGQDVCCVAGPGSGKTRVLVERFAWLVGRGVQPEAILAITFTEKAANEIKDRIVRRLAGDRERRRQAERAHVSTIHGFCHLLLREHAIQAGLDPQFRVMDELEAGIEQHSVMSRVLDSVAHGRRAEFRALLDAWPSEDLAGPLLGVYEALRMAGGAKPALQRLAAFDSRPTLQAIREELAALLAAPGQCDTPARRQRIAELRLLSGQAGARPWVEWLEALGKVHLKGLSQGHPVYDGLTRIRARIPEAFSHLAGEMYMAQRELVRDILLQFDEAFQARKRELAALDFHGLEEQALELLRRHQEVQRQTRERFEAILMDELQDTNPVQWRILELIRRPGRFFAVGDINQSIYGFRHADPSLFEQYLVAVRDSGGAIDFLEDNYRSRPEILQTVGRVCANGRCPGVRPHSLHAKREFAGGAPPYVELQCVAAGEDSSEPLWIARRLRELHGAPRCGAAGALRFGDMAILARTRAMFPELEAALGRFGIPCLVQKGKNFFEEPEILDLTNWLRVLENPAADIPLFALLRSPFFGAGGEELFRRRLAGRLLEGADRQRILRLHALRAALPASALLAQAIDECGYARRLDAGQQANVGKFLRLLDELEVRHGRDMEKHLEFILELRGSGQEANAARVDAADAVQLMTIHGAKGLEFPVVVLAGMQRGDRGGTPQVCLSPRLGLGLQWRLPGGRRVGDPVMQAHLAGTTEREDREDDRLLYVAMTRAEERLILSWTETQRQSFPWPELICRQLEIEIPSQAGAAGGNPLVSFVKRAGLPEIPPPVQTAGAAPDVEVRPAPAPGQAPSTVSVTSLSTFAQCPRRYLLQHLLEWPRKEARGSGAMELGASVHEYLAGLRPLLPESARALARAFEESELALRCARAPRVEREMDFLADLAGTLVRGQIDLWFDEGQGPVIVDYKTDQHPSPARLAGYELQLRFYALALEKLFGRPARQAWLFSLREGAARAVDIGPPALDQARRVLEQWRLAESAGDFPLRESPDCAWCPFAGGPCPAPARRSEVV